jgi:hypothetical protein
VLNLETQNLIQRQIPLFRRQWFRARLDHPGTFTPGTSARSSHGNHLPPPTRILDHLPNFAGQLLALFITHSIHLSN